jgi:hypothetical protein
LDGGHYDLDLKRFDADVQFVGGKPKEILDDRKLSITFFVRAFIVVLLLPICLYNDTRSLRLTTCSYRRHPTMMRSSPQSTTTAAITTTMTMTMMGLCFLYVSLLHVTPSCSDRTDGRSMYG